MCDALDGVSTGPTTGVSRSLIHCVSELTTKNRQTTVIRTDTPGLLHLGVYVLSMLLAFHRCMQIDVYNSHLRVSKTYLVTN